MDPNLRLPLQHSLQAHLPWNSSLRHLPHAKRLQTNSRSQYRYTTSTIPTRRQRSTRSTFPLPLRNHRGVPPLPQTQFPKQMDTDLQTRQMLWAFSIWLESVAILPQLFMLQRTGEAETITTHYLFALGLYRALYIPNWLYRYFAEGYVDQIAWIAGIVQTVLYSDFFYIYYTK